MKIKIACLAALLFVASVSHAEAAKRPVAIHLCVFSNEGKKEITSQTIIVPETEVVRIRIKSEIDGPIDLSFSPVIEGDLVRLTMRSFPKDHQGRDVQSALCNAYVMKLDSSVKMRDGALMYQVVASLNIPEVKKTPNQSSQPTRSARG
jgi:hypothetical protein